MTTPRQPQNVAGTPRVDGRTLWAGGIATALVVALIGLTGVVVFRGVLGIPVLAPEGEGTWGDATTVQLMGVAAGAALLATGLIHLLLVTTPRRGRSSPGSSDSSRWWPPSHPSRQALSWTARSRQR